jgi:hypothetical protein
MGGTDDNESANSLRVKGRERQRNHATVRSANNRLKLVDPCDVHHAGKLMCLVDASCALSICALRHVIEAQHRALVCVDSFAWTDNFLPPAAAP